MTAAQQFFPRPSHTSQMRRMLSLPGRARVIRGALALAALALLWCMRGPILDLFALAQDQEALRAHMAAAGAWGPLLLALLQLVQMVVAFIPGQLLTMAGGYLYGFPLGLALNLALLIGLSQGLFLLSRRFGRPLATRLAPPALLQRLDGMLEREGLPILVISFMLPFLPADAMNLVAGLSAMSPLRFLLASTVGRLPGAVLLTLVGAHGVQRLPLWACALTVLLLAGTVAFWLRSRRQLTAQRRAPITSAAMS